MNMQHLAGQVAQNAQDIGEMKALAKRQEIISMVSEIAAVQYGNAKAYANVVIVAGYAAFFTMLGIARGDIPHGATVLAILLLTFSASVFVLYEVFKMIWVSWCVRRHIFALDDPSDELTRLRGLHGATELEMRTLGKIWVIVLVLTIVPGVLAIAVLAWNLLALVLGQPEPNPNWVSP